MYRSIERLARLFAMAGGVSLTAMILLICVSVAGRAINSVLHSDLIEGLAPGLAAALLSTGVGPVNGDFEIVEAGMAFAIFAFLPVCQLHAAHAKVDIFTALLPRRVNRTLRAGIELLFAAVLILIAVQLFGGMRTMLKVGQTTLLLEFPVWWSFAASVVAATAAAMVGVYVAVVRVREAVEGTAILPQAEETAH